MLSKLTDVGLIIVVVVVVVAAVTAGPADQRASSDGSTIIVHARNRALKSLLLEHVVRDTAMPDGRGRQTVVYDADLLGSTVSIVDTPEFQAGNGREFLHELDAAATAAAARSGVNRVYFVVARNDSDSRIRANMNLLQMLYGERMAATIKLVIESDSQSSSNGDDLERASVQISSYNHCLYFTPESHHALPFLYDVYESSQDAAAARLVPEGRSLYETFDLATRRLAAKRDELRDEENGLLDTEHQCQHSNSIKILLIVIALMIALTTTTFAYRLKPVRLPSRTRAALVVLVSALLTLSAILFLASFLYIYTGTDTMDRMRIESLTRLAEHESAIAGLQSDLRFFLSQCQ